MALGGGVQKGGQVRGVPPVPPRQEDEALPFLRDRSFREEQGGSGSHQEGRSHGAGLGEAWENFEHEEEEKKNREKRAVWFVGRKRRTRCVLFYKENYNSKYN